MIYIVRNDRERRIYIMKIKVLLIGALIIIGIIALAYLNSVTSAANSNLSHASSYIDGYYSSK